MIHYLCEWTGESGGIKVLYDHVRLLRTLGVEACLASTGRFRRATWFDHDASAIPAVSDLRDRLAPDDLVVLPEFCLRDAPLGDLPCRVLPFVQNLGMVTGPLDAPRHVGVLTPSRPLAACLAATVGHVLPVHTVVGMIEDEWFAPAAPRRGRRPRVLVIDRVDKHRGEPARVARALEDDGVSVTVVRPRMDRRPFVDLFRAHDVYVHLSWPEGFPVSILEAFASGCLVAGFAGTGGLEFMRHGENCSVVPDGDVSAAVAAVHDVVGLSEDAARARRAAAVRTAREYSESRTRDDLALLSSRLAVKPVLDPAVE